MYSSNRLILLALSIGIFVYPAQRGPKQPMPKPTQVIKPAYMKPRGTTQPHIRIREPRFKR